ncbi:C40 family peptidase [Flexithrix dorotheae]|uniref:C40 family peptidase n=1 Tax=Flexithrix dorotheae TaxID=70993 RepID=UPI00037D537F|nr:C40 family peptidase [Flexithrix dorotheae]
MDGIQFITDKEGNKRQVVVDMAMYSDLLKKLYKKLDLDPYSRIEVSPRVLHISDGGGIEPMEVEQKNVDLMRHETFKKREMGIPSVVEEQPDDIKKVMGMPESEKSLKIQAILETASSYMGTPHLLGGESHDGIDCSGLTCVSYKSAEIQLPRVSYEQAKVGNPKQITELKEGDLVFFGTGQPGKINHVGVVSNADDINNITFIHASSSRGVMESSLSSGYWNGVYIKGNRIV